MSPQHKGKGNCHKNQIFACVEGRVGWGRGLEITFKNLRTEKMPRLFATKIQWSKAAGG